MLFAWVGTEAAKLGDGVGNIWTSTGSQIHQGTHSVDIWHLSHLSAFCISLGRHVLSEVESRLHRSLYRRTPTEPIVLQHVYDVLTLREGQGTLGPITSDLDAQQERAVTQVSELKVLGQLCNDFIRICVRRSRDGDVVHVDNLNACLASREGMAVGG